MLVHTKGACWVSQEAAHWPTNDPSSPATSQFWPPHPTLGPVAGQWRTRRSALKLLSGRRGYPCPMHSKRGGGRGWHKVLISLCLPLAAPIGLSPLLILTLCGSEHVLVALTEPPDDLSCLITPGVGCPGDGLLPVPLTRCIQMHTPSPCGGLPTPALTYAPWGVHLRDHFPDKGF